MNKLTSIRIKKNDGTYSEDIPIQVLVDNVIWIQGTTISLTDILGEVAYSTKGSIQHQLDTFSLTELENARVGVDDTQYQNLKDRLDSEYNNLQQVSSTINENLNIQSNARLNADNLIKTELNSEIISRTNLDRYIIFPAMSPVFNPHGNCCAITYGTHAILFDLGLVRAFSEIRDSLKKYGIDTIDAIFISHYHGDHDGNPYDISSYNVWSNNFDMTNCVFYLPLDPPQGITGWERTTKIKLMEAFPNNTFVFPPYGKVVINGVSIEAFNNTTEEYTYLQNQGVTDYNQYSQIIRAEYLGSSVLFMGDAGRAAQEYQYSLGHFTPTKIFVVPHHGLDGDSLIKISNIVSPQYAYISNGYNSNQFLRDMLLVALGDNGTTIIDNVSTYPKDTVGLFGSACTLTGGTKTYTSYAGYGHNAIYFDSTADPNSYQDGTEEHPFSSMRRVIVHCNGGYTTVYCKSPIINNSGAIQITADNGYIEFMGSGYSATEVSFLLNAGARATFNSFAGIGLLQLDNASFAKVVACGTVPTGVVNESILVGSSTIFTNFSYRNAMVMLQNVAYTGTGTL